MRRSRAAILVSQPRLGQLRNAASACRVPGFAGSSLSNGTNTTMNGRAGFVNESGRGLSSLALIYSGWYLDTISEIIAPNDYTVTAAVEYPSGTFKQVTWSGATSTTVTAGTNITSDLIGVTIPKGATFWIRTFVSVSAGQKWPNSSLVNSNFSELGQAGVGLTDVTMGGTITGTTACLRPSAVLSSFQKGFSKVSFAIFGDSITAGSGDGLWDSSNNIGGFCRGTAGVCPIIAGGVSGTQLHNQVISGKFNYRLDLIQKAGVTHMQQAYGVNDIAQGAATIESDMSNLWGQVNTLGIKVLQHTITPKGSATTDAWQSTAGQTVAGGFSGDSSTRGLVNTNIRTVPYPLYDYVEIADALETSRNSSVWGVGSTFNATHLAAQNSWTVGAGATTTSIPSNSNKATNYYTNGGAITFDGNITAALAGVRKTVSANTSGGTFTVGALTQAPAQGDTFTAVPLSYATTNDGLHPANNGNASPFYGGVHIMKDQIQAKIKSWQYSNG